MVIDYDGYTMELWDGKAGIHHRFGRFIDPATFSTTGGEEFRGVKFVAWVMEEVSFCRQCDRDNVIVAGICDREDVAPYLPSHFVAQRERKREVEIWLTYDQAFELGLTLMRDFSMGRYGVG